MIPSGRLVSLGAGIALVAVLGLAGWRGAVWLREDARNDLLRELTVRQAEASARNARQTETLVREIENADPDGLHRHACTLGVLPAESCR